MAVDIQNLFNVTLPAGLAKNAEKAVEIGAKFQINITGEGGGEWYIDVQNNPPSVSQSNPGTADVTLTLAAEDFQKVVENPGAGMQLFFAGKLKVSGNQMLAMKLNKLFELQ